MEYDIGSYIIMVVLLMLGINLIKIIYNSIKDSCLSRKRKAFRKRFSEKLLAQFDQFKAENQKKNELRIKLIKNRKSATHIKSETFEDFLLKQQTKESQQEEEEKNSLT